MIRRISILGCGWLGLPLGASLAEQGFEVKGSSTRPERLPAIRERGIQPFLIELGHQVEGPQKQAFFDTDLLILNIPPGGRRDPHVEESYPRKVMAVVEALQASPAEKLIFVGSTSVYGNENREVAESDTLQPSTPSGRALVTIENYLQLLERPQVTILRMAGLVGGNRQAGRFLAGKKDLPHGEAPVNLVHRDDCIGIMTAVIQKGAWGETFNVCAGQHPSRTAFYTTQARKLGLEPPSFKDSGSLSFKIVSNEKVKQALGYQFLHPDPMAF